MDPAAVLAAVRAAPVAEVAWRGTGPRAGGPPRATGVLPLVEAAGPVLALPYAERALAAALGDADEVLLTLTEPRGSGAAFTPLLLRCRPRLVPDPQGERFVATLLDQELVRWPPSRLRADSVLLRREHWWWLPRLLVELAVHDVEPLPARTAPEHHLLVVAVGEGLEARVAAVAPNPFAVRVCGTDPGAGEAVLLGQDVSLPDLERWGRWSWSGHWADGTLAVARQPGRVGLPPVPGVLARWRAHRDLERACRAGLRAAGV